MSVSEGTDQSIGPRATAHLGFVDQLRGVAILAVFLIHCTTFNASLFDPLGFIGQVFSGKATVSQVIDFLCFYPCHLGWSGVAIFFVVSGFCIHLSYSQPGKPDLIGFYIRRFFRIYPAYLVAVLVFGLFVPYSRLDIHQWQNWMRLLAHLLLCHNLSFSLGGISGSYWTIPVEAQLYLLYPVLLLFVRRYSFGRALWIVGLVEFSLQITTALAFNLLQPPQYWISASPIYYLFSSSPFYYWFSWSIGAAICDDYLKGKPSPLQKIPPWLWLIGAVATSGFVAHEFSFAFFALATASLLSRHLSRQAAEAPPSLFGRFLRVTGTYSYSIYLIHGPIIDVVKENFKLLLPGLANNIWAMFFATLSSWLIIFPLAALMYYTVEKPCISLGKRLLKARSQRQTQLARNSVLKPLGVR